MNQVATKHQEECLLRAGNTNCGGCGMSNALTMFGRALGQQPSTMVIPACCGIVTAGAFPTTSYGVPVIAATFASSPAFGSGVAAASEINQDDQVTVCWAGDGGTYDIGLGTLSAAAERNENMIYVCYDNEIYGNTGGQRSSATPPGAKTTTTPKGKYEEKKNILEIIAAHRVPYAATLSIAHPEDFERKVKTAMGISGFRFFLVHSPCPTGWKSEPGESVELVRTAVRSGLFPLYEVYDGVHYEINERPDGTDPEAYFQKQRRFKSESLDMDAVKAQAKTNFERLEKLATIN